MLKKVGDGPLALSALATVGLFVKFYLLSPRMRPIREGVSRDGRPLFPMMPYKAYSKTLSDEDDVCALSAPAL
jgi:hypothetical protein